MEPVEVIPEPMSERDSDIMDARLKVFALLLEMKPRERALAWAWLEGDCTLKTAAKTLRMPIRTANRVWKSLKMKALRSKYRNF